MSRNEERCDLGNALQRHYEAAADERERQRLEAIRAFKPDAKLEDLIAKRDADPAWWARMNAPNHKSAVASYERRKHLFEQFNNNDPEDDAA